MTLSIFCDGGARGNPGPAAIGWAAADPSGKIIHEHHEFIGSTTNNVAEYRAVISALEWLIKHKLTFHFSLFTFHFYLDSALVVNQLNGLFKIKQAHLRELILKIKTLEQELSAPITYTAVPRDQNSAADALVNKALDQQLQ